MQLEDIYFFEFGLFGLEEDLKALPVHLKGPPIIILEGGSTVIGGF